MKVSYLYYLIYILIALLHVYIIKDNFLVVFLVIIFEITRLIALLNKAKIIIFVLAIFSCIFIVSNYKATSDTSQQILQNNLQIASNINNYTSKYWVNGDKYKQLIDIQNTSINNLHYLPNWIVIAVLITLIELSMAYMIIMNTKTNPKPKFQTKPIETKSESINENNNNSSKQLKVVNGKYFTGNHEISRSYYYKLKTKP